MKISLLKDWPRHSRTRNACAAATLLMLSTALPADCAWAEDLFSVARTKQTGELQPPTTKASELGFGIGDKLKISFYERLTTTDDKWINSKQPMRPDQSFYLHSEISGDYKIQDDLFVDFPLIGRHSFAARSSQEMEEQLSAAFEALIKRPAFVNIVRVERQPIYIIGPVKLPGVYHFEQGMTPLHAVALAGGFQVTEPDRSSIVESIRENSKLESSLEHLKRALARWAVLRAEIGGIKPTIPAQLKELAGPDSAKDIVASEQSQRDVVVNARNVRTAYLASAVESAQQAVDMAQARLEPLRATIQMRRARLAGLQKLFNVGNADKVVILQAQSELSDVEDREAGVRSGVSEAQQRLALAKLEQGKFYAEATADLDREIALRRNEIDELTPYILSSATTIKVLQPAESRISVGSALQYEIVRQTPNGAELIAATVTTSLRPGDLLQIKPVQQPNGPPPSNLSMPTRSPAVIASP